MQEMKAVRLYAKCDLRVEDVPLPPSPPPGWVRVKVTRAGICGSDLHNFKTGQWITRSPSIAGHEFTGIVAECGPETKGFHVGDKVAADSRFWCGDCAACRNGAHQLCEKLGFIGEMCDGCFAEEVNLPEKLLHKVPHDLAAQIAATAEPFAVALHTVRRLRLQPGEPVLIAGCGPIGGFAAVILKHMGLGPILVADSNAERAELVAKVTDASVVELNPGAVTKALHGRRAVSAIDATGSIAALRALIDCVGSGGAIALVGISHGTIDLDPNILVERELSLIGCHAFEGELPEAIALLPSCAAMIMQLIDREIGPEDVPAAYARIAAGEAKGLKTLIRFNASE
jgi:(R,R)-butanediol dehydrogenase / meso-butanediol dehydrogenase / diacetyl reductase